MTHHLNKNPHSEKSDQAPLREYYFMNLLDRLRGFHVAHSATVQGLNSGYRNLKVRQNVLSIEITGDLTSGTIT